VRLFSQKTRNYNQANRNILKSIKMNLQTLLVMGITFWGTVKCGCSEDDTSVASIEFKDCMDVRQAELLQIDLNADNNLAVFCDGLERFSGGCAEIIGKFSSCKTRQYVENLVAIHIDSMADLLTQLNPALDLKTCSVFVRPTPPPLVHHVEHRATQLPLTSSTSKLSSSSFPSFFSLLIVAMSILCRDL